MTLLVVEDDPPVQAGLLGLRNPGDSAIIEV
jgi:hypothetical protein